MERISKPHIVDLLRVFDRKRWIQPRIRYASVRSKPELIKDLQKYFYTYERGDILHIKLRGAVEATLSHIPEICYDFSKKVYLFDSRPFDVQSESRKKVRFSISHVPVTLFGPSEDPLSTSTASACAQAFLGPGSSGHPCS